MLTSDIMYRVCARIDEADPANPISVSNQEVLNAVNDGQMLASLLTLCFVKTTTYLLTGTPWYTPRQTLTDLIAPLRISVNGTRLRPSTLSELDAWNRNWQTTPGTPARYATLGCNLLAVTPQSAEAAAITYAASPVPLATTDTPALPGAYHQALIEYGVYRVRLKEGAQQLARGLGNLNIYLDSMTELGDWVRNRSKASHYDIQPIEMQLLDRSKLIDSIIARQARREAAAAAKKVAG